jgi:hypothetical protein
MMTHNGSIYKSGKQIYNYHLISDDSGSLNLTITVNVNLTENTVMNPDGTVLAPMHGRFPALPWPPGRFAIFKDTFKRDGTVFWDNRFTLEWSNINNFAPENSFPKAVDLSQGLDLAGSRPALDDRYTVKCGFKIELVSSGAHYNIPVAYLDPSAKNNNRFIQSPIIMSDGALTEESVLLTREKQAELLKDKGLLGSRTINNFRDMRMTQKQFLHEIGHLIGLEHIGVLRAFPDCIAVNDNNSLMCYVNFDNGQFSDNIMGGGMQLSRENAQPWINAMAGATNTQPSDWMAHKIR